LIQDNKVSIVLGGTSSANTLAMGAVAKRSRVPFIGLNAAAREVTGKACNRFMFRAPASVPVYARAMAPELLAAQAADSAAELEQLFGSKDEIGCTMEAI
jgi:branched-chain amino acid transport system substrate-binding protein